MTSHSTSDRRGGFEVYVVGIGAGSAEHLTVEAIEALRRLDVVLLADKGEATADLVAAREAICQRFIDGPPPRFIAVPDPVRTDPGGASGGAAAYAKAVAEWHGARADRYGEIIAGLPPGSTVGFLVWGDPALYDSTIRIVDAVARRYPLTVRVVPGISAFQALAAAHGIVLHEVGMPVHITTGRRLLQEWPTQSGSVVVMLDGGFTAGVLADTQPDLRIHWGAYLGLPQQTLRAGRLGDLAEEIVALRQGLRVEHGWIMDTYVLSPAE